MALGKQWKCKNGAECAIWKIDEEEQFFVAQTGLVSEKIHPLKRIEHLAARYLLSQLAPDIVLKDIQLSTSGKPFVPGLDIHFSLSHSYPYVAATVSNENYLGIDIQILREKIHRVQHKFLSEKEQSFCNNDIQKLTLAWCAKEAAFKYYEQIGLDYIQHLPITSFQLNADNEAVMEIELKKVEPYEAISIIGAVTDEYAFAYVDEIS